MTTSLEARESPVASSLLKNLSVVICTKDRPIELAQAVRSIRESGPAGRLADILVVEESDQPSPVLGVRRVSIPLRGQGFGYARNVALLHAAAELVVFIDDDCTAAPGWLEALIEPFQKDPSVLGVAGAVLVRDCGRIGYAENVLGFPGGGLRYHDAARGQVVPTKYLSTCNCAYRRSAILEAGGFLQQARQGGEDSLLAERISRAGPCVYAPQAIVYHRTRDSLPAVFRWFTRRGMSELAMLRQVLDRANFLRYLTRSSWTLRLAGLTVVVALWPETLWTLPALVVGYYAVLLWRFRFTRRYPTHRSAWWLVPVVKMTMDAGTEVGRWRQLVSRRGA
jgi:GT2 family glycosyltransferase